MADEEKNDGFEVLLRLLDVFIILIIYLVNTCRKAKDFVEKYEGRLSQRKSYEALGKEVDPFS